MTRRKYTDGETVYGIDVDGDDRELDVITYEHGDPSKYDVEPPKGRLPSMGEQTDSCGRDWLFFCVNCGRDHDSAFCCNRSLCPRCWAYWDMQTSTTAVAKLEQTRQQLMNSRYNNRNDEYLRFHHVAIGFAPGFESVKFDCNDPLAAMVDIAETMIDAASVAFHGGKFIYHSKSGEEGEDDRGKWKSRIGMESSEEEVEDELEHRPHLHCLILAHSVDHLASEAVYDETGLILKRIERSEKGNNTSLYGITELASAMTYTHSHADIADTENGTRIRARWRGDVATTSPSDNVKAWANSEVRKVASETLGVPFSDHTCHAELEDDEEGAEEFNQGYSGTGSGPDEAELEDFLNEKQTCTGRTVDIRKAPKFLNDDEWCEKAPYADRLRDVWEIWKDKDPPGMT